MKRRTAALLLAILLTLGLTVPAFAAGTAGAYERAAAYVQKAVPAPTVGSIGGEWAVIGLCRGKAALPEGYLTAYLDRAEAYVREKGGVLHARKYTEYSRVVLAFTVLGRDARDVGGYDLTLPLGDYDKTLYQGLNGPIWALIALDSGNYPMPQNARAATQATRQMYVDVILSRQLPGGGWSLSGSGDPDLMAMALTALAPYREQEAVSAAVDRALTWLSQVQQEDGGFSTGGVSTAESCAQVLSALCALGIEERDGRFVKNGRSVLDALLDYQLSDGSFCHVKEGGSNQMATEQALYALSAQKAGGGTWSLSPQVEYIPWTALLCALLAGRLG